MASLKPNQDISPFAFPILSIQSPDAQAPKPLYIPLQNDLEFFKSIQIQVRDAKANCIGRSIFMDLESQARKEWSAIVDRSFDFFADHHLKCAFCNRIHGDAFKRNDLEGLFVELQLETRLVDPMKVGEVMIAGWVDRLSDIAIAYCEEVIKGGELAGFKCPTTAEEKALERMELLSTAGGDEVKLVEGLEDLLIDLRDLGDTGFGEIGQAGIGGPSLPHQWVAPSSVSTHEEAANDAKFGRGVDRSRKFATSTSKKRGARGSSRLSPPQGNWPKPAESAKKEQINRTVGTKETRGGRGERTAADFVREINKLVRREEHTGGGRAEGRPPRGGARGSSSDRGQSRGARGRTGGI